MSKDWNCKRCTFLNDAGVEKCSMCFWRPEQDIDRNHQVILDGGSKENPLILDGQVGSINEDVKVAALVKTEKKENSRMFPIVLYDDALRQQNSFAVIDLTGDADAGSSNDEDNQSSFAHRFAAQFGQGRSTPWAARSLREIRKQHRDDLTLARKLDAEEKMKAHKKLRFDTSYTDDQALARALQLMEDDERRKAAEAAAAAADSFDVLADHRTGIRDMLKEQAKGINVTSVAENPHSCVGTELYNRFVEAWQRVEDQTVTLAFRGTAEANFEPICRDGLDPKLRTGQALGCGEYFGKQAAQSLGYCRGGRKMLVVALLTDKTGLTAQNVGVLVINKPEHQLPLFVVSF